jgi:AcrR family transcriptional regulator
MWSGLVMPKKSLQKERKIQVLEALHTCLLTKPYKDISTRDIATAAHLNQGSLYYFFKDKEDILLQYIDHVLDRYVQRFVDWLGRLSIDYRTASGLLEEASDFLRREILFNRDISLIFIELWSLSGSNARVKAKLQSVYRQWEEIMTSVMVQYGVDKGVARKLSRGIISFDEGIAVCLVVMEKDVEELKDILDWFKYKVIADIEASKKSRKTPPLRRFLPMGRQAGEKPPKAPPARGRKEKGGARAL